MDTLYIMYIQTVLRECLSINSALVHRKLATLLDLEDGGRFTDWHIDDCSDYWSARRLLQKKNLDDV